MTTLAEVNGTEGFFCGFDAADFGGDFGAGFG